MKPEQRSRFRSVRRTLKDGREVRLRFIARDDGDRMAAFYAQVPRESFRFYCPYDLTAEQANKNASLADDPHRVVLVMEDMGDGAIGGYAWYRWRDDDAETSTFGICICPSFQHVGAGRVLMTRLLTVAEQVGPPVMTLTVQCANSGAVHLYRSMGFEVVREQSRKPSHGFGPEPEYAMALRLRAVE
jgi:ribosomal protein S18 acetylase RimI-like enzyme